MKKLRFTIAPQFSCGNFGFVMDNPSQGKHFGIEGPDGNNRPFSSILLDEEDLIRIVKYLQNYLKEPDKCVK